MAPLCENPPVTYAFWAALRLTVGDADDELSLDPQPTTPNAPTTTITKPNSFIDGVKTLFFLRIPVTKTSEHGAEAPRQFTPA
jgi:hypothetical protein